MPPDGTAPVPPQTTTRKEPAKDAVALASVGASKAVAGPTRLPTVPSGPETATPAVHARPTPTAPEPQIPPIPSTPEAPGATPPTPPHAEATPTAPSPETVSTQPVAPPAQATVDAPRAPAPSPPPTQPHAYPAPAAQVAPAVVSLAAATRPGQPQHLTIRLDPGALGAVEVRIERSSHGPTRIELSVERPDTLLTLMADRPALNAALDLAGVPPEGRTVQFSLTPSDPGPSNNATSGNGSGTSGGSGGAPGGGRDGDRPPPLPPRRTRLRTGIDITA